MQSIIRSGLALAIVMASLLAFNSTVHAASTFQVNTEADTPDANIGDGVCADSNGDCSLRAAVQEANLDPNSTIKLPPGNYTLNILGVDDTAAAGDLDILTDMSILGSGLQNTVINSSGVGESVFTVDPTGIENMRIAFTNLTAISTFTSTGGALYIHPNNFVAATNVRFSGVSVNNGGAVVNNKSAFIASYSVFDNSVSDLNGGAIYNEGGFTQLNYSIVATNESYANGGGIYDAGGELALFNTVFTGNFSTDGGGAIYSDSGQVRIVDSWITGNRSGLAGGLLMTGPGALGLISSTVDHNVSEFNGGGMILSGGMQADVLNSTFSRNLALNTGTGGGILVTDSGTVMNLNQSTLTLNNADGIGGGLFKGAGTANVYMSIIAQNTAVTTSPDCGGTFTTLGYNVIGDDTNCTGFVNGVNNDQVGSGGSPLNAELLPLGDYGGPTPTHLPKGTSPAFASGDPTSCYPTATGIPPVDQREQARISCDVGAVDGGVTNLVYNYEFEYDTNYTGTPDFWTPINLSSGDRRICTLDGTGDCVARFAGTNGAQKVLRQVIPYEGVINDELVLHVNWRAFNLSPNSNGVRVVLSGGGNSQTINLVAPAGNYDFTVDSTTITANINFDKITIYAGTQDTQGSLLVEDIYLLPVP